MSYLEKLYFLLDCLLHVNHCFFSFFQKTITSWLTIDQKYTFFICRIYYTFQTILSIRSRENNNMILYVQRIVSIWTNNNKIHLNFIKLLESFAKIPYDVIGFMIDIFLLFHTFNCPLIMTNLRNSTTSD